jgi:sigma-B regulation protein RsbU (phosphoserine phosphatase)
MEMGAPSEVISRVNRDLARDNGPSMFVTVFLCVIDLETNIATYTNAGHSPPLLRCPDGSVKRLDERHGPFAAIAEEHQYGESQIHLNPGDLLLLFTDGVTEAMNEENQLFTECELKNVVLNYGGTSCAGLVNQVLSRVRSFEGKMDPSDDLTLLAFRLREVSWEDYGTEVLTAQLDGDLLEIEVLIANFDTAAQEFGVPDKVRKQLAVVFDELLSNTICHGFTGEDAHSIEVKVRLQDEVLQVILKDDGLPFDPFQHEIPDITAPLEERTTGGLGIHIVRSLVDNADYLRKDGMNIITLFKSFNSSQS